MKWWILKSGCFDFTALVQQEVAKPEPGPGEVRVRVKTVSLDYRDLLVVTHAGLARQPAARRRSVGPSRS